MSDPKKVDGAVGSKIRQEHGLVAVPEQVPVKEGEKSSYTPPKDNFKNIWAKLTKTSPISEYGWLDSEGKHCEPAHNRDCKAH